MTWRMGSVIEYMYVAEYVGVTNGVVVLCCFSTDVYFFAFLDG